MHIKHLIVIVFACWATFQAQAADKVLLLNSYHPQYKWTAELTRGVQESLVSKIAPENLFIEFMDKRRFIDDQEYYDKLYNLLYYKYHKNTPDIIITSDDGAYQFVLEHADQLFADIPIVFSGVNVFNPADISDRPNITGIAEGMDIEGNLNLIKKLQADIENIIILGDTTGLGLRTVNEAKRITPEWQNKNGVRTEIWDQFTLQELYEKVTNLDDKNAILILAVHKDQQGEYFSYDEHLSILSQHSKAPIYGMWGAILIGNGVVGGVMNDPYEHGFNTANIALKILSGTPVNQIPVKNSAVYKARFDFKQLLKFGLHESDLLNNDNVFNKPQTLYQQHQLEINIGAGIILFLLLLNSMLSRSIYQRRKAELELKRFNTNLEHTVAERTLELEQRNKDLELATESMKKLAHTDTLTGLKNRRAASIEIPDFLKNFNKNNRSLVLAIIDIDFFKKINDQFGHQIGDKVLQELSNQYIQYKKPEDEVYRWGGEEFIILFMDADSEKVKHRCEMFSKHINTIVIDEVRNMTVSIGISEFVQGDTYDSIIKRADNVLYQAKNTGRNKVVIG